MRVSDEELELVRGTKVIGYVRESSVRNEHKISLDIQEMAMTETAGWLNLDIVRWIKDSDKTGRNFDRNIQIAIQACMRGEADHILVYNLSRFGRDYWGCIDYARSLRAAGHLLISTDRREGVIDIDTSEGRDKAHDAFSWASDQADKIGEGWSNVHKLNFQKGLAHHNTERWGYQWCANAPCKERRQCKECRDAKSDKFCRKCPPRPTCDDCHGKPQIKDPEIAPVVEETLNRIVSNEPVNTIARNLNARGYRTPLKKNEWTSSALYIVLDTGYQAGYIRRPPKDPTAPKSGAKALLTSIYTRGAHEPIFSEEKWRAYVKLRTQNIDAPQSDTKAKYAESGFLFCVECGSRMNAQRHGKTWCCDGQRKTGCRNTNGNGEIVSELVLNFLRTHTENTDFLDQVQKSLRDHLAAINAQPIEKLEEYEKLEVDLKAERRELASNLNKKRIEPEDYDAEKERLDAAIKAAQHQISLLVPRDLPTFPPASFLRDVFAKWHDLSFESRRTILKSLVWRIEVSKGNLHARDRYKIIPLWDAYLTGDINNPRHGRR